MTQNDHKNDENAKFFNFQRFNEIFVNISIDFVAKNVENAQKEKICFCPRGFFEEINAIL